jgi:hypothetical protein
MHSNKKGKKASKGQPTKSKTAKWRKL